MSKHHPLSVDSTGLSLKQPLRVALESASKQWGDALQLLNASLNSIKGVHITLLDAYAEPLCEPSERGIVRELLGKFDAEVESLASCENLLRDMRVTATAARNRSVILAPVNTLPPELLARIFSLLDTCLVRNPNHNPQNFAAVCKHWRQVVMNISTHIDFGPSIPSSLTQRLLERTNRSPVYMHICELATREEATTEQISMDLELLLPHLHRIEVLDIESYSYSRKLAGSILNLWLQNGNPALAKSLLISRPNAALVLSSTGSGRSVTIMSHSANSQAILQSLKGLHLQNVVFNWESVAYRGLVNLRLDFSRASIPVAISIHQLSDILSANPALSSLELGYLDIINSPDWSPIPTELYCLRILTLSFINSGSLQLLLPLISLPKSPVEIGIGPTALDLICRELEDCLARAPNVTALKLRQDERHLFSNWLSFLRVLPRLSILALDNFHMSNEPAIETNIGDHVSCPDLHLSLVLLLNCTVTLEGLHILVREHNVQILHLERCGTLVEDQNTLEDTRTYLLAAHPNLSCTISSVSEIEHLEFSRMLSL